jgi:serine/alanine adding enzyme
VKFPPSVYSKAYGLPFLSFDGSDAGLYVLRNLSGRAILSSAPYLTDTDNYPRDPSALLAFAAFAESARERLSAEYAVCPTRDPGVSAVWGERCQVSHRFVTSILDLNADPDWVWHHRLHRKRRKQVERGKAFGATFEWGRAELLDPFYEVIARSQTDLGTPVHAKRYFEAILSEMPESEIVVGWVNGKPVSTALTVAQNGTLFHPYTGTLKPYLPGYLNCTLYWELIQGAIQRRCLRFDLGRSFLNSGVHQFKGYWGATDTPLYYCYFMAPGAVVPDLKSPLFTLATQVWSHLPTSFARWLGPSLIWRVP